MSGSVVMFGWARAVGVGLAVAALGGCGAPPPEAPVERWIVTSVAECAAMTGTPEATCTAVIEAAIALHTTQSPSYQTVKLCEKAEGTDMCERLEERVWRAKPQAYLIARSNQVVTATMLYAGKDKAIVFRAADTTTYDPDKGDKTEYSPTSLRRVAAFGQS